MPRNAALLTAVLLLAAPAAAIQETTAAAEKPRWESSHSILVGEETVEYDAVVASTTLTNDDGEPAGELFYTAYFRTNGAPSRERPLVFAYNGGPGSASFWLHMGIMGPRRVVTPEVGPQGAPPYPLEDKRLHPPRHGRHRHGGSHRHRLQPPRRRHRGLLLLGDRRGRPFARAVRAPLPERVRPLELAALPPWARATGPPARPSSPAISSAQTNPNIDLNGIVLVSVVLQFNTIQFAPGDDIPYIVNLPSYAITARYLDRLPGGSPDDLGAFMAEVEAWSLTEYATALLAGTTLDPERRSRVIDRMHLYTGLSKDFIAKSDLRVTAPEFEAELLRDEGRIVGRLDARFTGPAGDVLGVRPSHDPQSSAISSAYTSAFNSYLRGELGYDGEREYVPSGATRNWNWGRLRGGGVFGRGGGDAQCDSRPRPGDEAQPGPQGAAGQRDLRPRHPLLRRRLVRGTDGPPAGTPRQHRAGRLRRRTHDVRGAVAPPPVEGGCRRVHRADFGKVGPPQRPPRRARTAPDRLE